MTLGEAVALGVVQGTTECLPVSSSAHLVMAERLLGIPSAGVAVEVVLHLGTLLAIVVFFRAQWLDILRRLRDPEGRRAVGMLAAATVPAGLAGVCLHGWIKAVFHDIRLVSINLIVCGVFLVAVGGRRQGSREMGWARALAVGVAQAFAILPGISRSGATVGTGILCGVRGSRAVEFAFMLAVPAILGAAAVEGREIGASMGGAGGAALLAGAAAACVSGYLAMRALMGAVRAGRLSWFGYYCILAGAACRLWG